MNKNRRCDVFSALLTIMAVLLLLALFGKSVHADEHPHATTDTVILLHGLGRTPLSMSALANHLENQGYVVYNVSYPSTRLPLPELTDRYVAPAVAQAHYQHRQHKIHFVTHSMGGILVRDYLARHPGDNIGRVVMLAPPNQGSEIIDALDNYPLTRSLIGPAGQELATQPDTLTNILPPLSCEVGIIAGTRSFNPIFSHLISGEDDGKVSVQSTTLPEMQDHIVLHIDHTFIMWNQQVLDQVSHFLKNGKFQD
jgi:hypothetical protein